MFTQLLSRIQRNHGLEHATVHLLTEYRLPFSVQGQASLKGFRLNIYGDVPENYIISAVQEAFMRMKQGHHHLAFHPDCGTMLATSAVCATLAGQAGFLLESTIASAQEKKKAPFMNSFLTATVFASVALLLSKPLGRAFQTRYTVDGDLGQMQILKIVRIQPNWMTRFFSIILGQHESAPVTSYYIHTAG